MKKHNYGHIVTISSAAGLFGIPNLVPYCATKFAVRGLMEALDEELRTDKKNEVKTTTIYPFMVNTGLCKNPYNRFEKYFPMVQAGDAAKAIMDAQRRELKDVSIPKFIFYTDRILR